MKITSSGLSHLFSLLFQPQFLTGSSIDICSEFICKKLQIFLKMSGRLKRIIEKNGKLNILNDIDKSFSVFHLNFLEIHWYKFVTLFASLHVLSFLFFSLVYYLTDVYHSQGTCLTFLLHSTVQCPSILSFKTLSRSYFFWENNL